MAALPEHIRDEIYGYALNHLGHTRANAQPGDIFRGIGSAILRGTEYADPSFNLAIRQIVRAAESSIASAQVLDMMPGYTPDASSLPIDYGLLGTDRDYRYRVRVTTSDTATNRKTTDLVNVRSDRPLSADEAIAEGIRTVREHESDSPQPSWVPLAQVEYTGTVISAGRKN